MGVLIVTLGVQLQLPVAGFVGEDTHVPVSTLVLAPS